ncbi:rhodanese-like domain-containing protein [Chryseobacterium daecheongense]|uniref:Rhodanese-like domain-containing protein n=1 Tax=Chryseobacterium daecheongense TaxID=192389 RepID=A0A3N0VZ89_9FLAO|nr:rhodanese-like domain-containing protein [Chryseobacterium daecheongense]ROH97840.1 rhodanese-like domain-containing protein [Chryseobacterium daecheongense]TDX92988.1 rhodanese-related sulfurtransferase [Chryseobacterium daecheongense]
MLDAIKNLFGMDKTDYADLVKQGAVIVDVRSESEYTGGHIKNSLNIPVDQLEKNLSKLSKDKTIITCCASGMRSASAKSILQNNGYKNVHNGGEWMILNTKI